MLLKYEMCENRYKSYLYSFGEKGNVPSEFLIKIDRKQYDYYKDKDKCYMNIDSRKIRDPQFLWKGSMGSIIEVFNNGEKRDIDIDRIYLDKYEIINEVIMD